MFIGEKDKEETSKDNKKEPLVKPKKKKKRTRKTRYDRSIAKKVVQDGTKDQLCQMLLIGQIE